MKQFAPLDRPDGLREERSTITLTPGVTYHDMRRSGAVREASYVRRVKYADNGTISIEYCANGGHASSSGPASVKQGLSMNGTVLHACEVKWLAPVGVGRSITVARLDLATAPPPERGVL